MWRPPRGSLSRCHVLDRLDEALESAIQGEPALLLIPPTNTQLVSPPSLTNSGSEAATVAAEGASGIGDGGVGTALSSLRDTEKLVLACLQFLAVVMRNCLNKQIFSSSEVRALSW